MKILFLLFISVTTFAAEYEFLTPQVLVIKGGKATPAGATSNPCKGWWIRENALLRDKNGKILRKPDITCYRYFIFDKPFASGEKRIIGSIPVQYDSGKPSNIFKLNQVGNGAKQKTKYAYMGAWLGSAGALPLKHLAGREFELRNASTGKCVFKKSLVPKSEFKNY